MEITDFRIVGMLDPEDEAYPDPVTVFAREAGLIIANCRFSVNGEAAVALVSIPRGVIGDSEFDLYTHCREVSQGWANDQRRSDA